MALIEPFIPIYFGEQHYLGPNDSRTISVEDRDGDTNRVARGAGSRILGT